jgi:hypothetical protein
LEVVVREVSMEREHVRAVVEGPRAWEVSVVVAAAVAEASEAAAVEVAAVVVVAVVAEGGNGL